jgi:predicted HicB family RNase H-like nuclease
MTKKEKSAPRGRPEIPEKERRSVLLQVRVTEKEALGIRQKAEKSGLSVSEWLRDCINSQ